MKTGYTYLPTGAVYTIAVSNSSGALESLTYTYDESGNRKSMVRDNIEAKLPSAFTSAPVYDNANRLTSFNSATVLHDLNGNITSWGSTSYTRNAKNQLIAISGTSLTASFKYDAVGRRVEKTINGTTTKYLYDGADIIMEMNGSGTPTVFYVRTLNIDEPLARIDLSTGDIRYYHADALGSIIALTDENGTVKTQYNYSPFGVTEVIGSDSAGLSQPFRYTAREWDGDTGLYYYRARYYSPEMGRFISEDPIGLAGGINMYAYVGNSPLNWIDPWGLLPKWAVSDEKREKAIEIFRTITNNAFSEREINIITDIIISEMKLREYRKIKGIEPDTQGKIPLTGKQKEILEKLFERMRNKEKNNKDLVDKAYEEYLKTFETGRCYITK